MPRLSRKTTFIALVAALTVSACDPQLPGPTPTRTLTGPLSEPSPTVRIDPPTRAAEDLSLPGQTIPEAAGVPPDSAIPPVEIATTPGAPMTGSMRVQLTVAQGVQLEGNLYQPALPPEGPTAELTRVPGVLLIGLPLDGWGALPVYLRDAGFTVIVMQMRPENALADFDVVLRAFSEAQTVDPGLVAVIGALPSGAELALSGCAANDLCDAVVLISPANTPALRNAMISYAPRPALALAAIDDTSAIDAARALDAVTTGEFALQTYPGGAQGSALIAAESSLPETIRAWLRVVLVQ
jgi:hypothetical protein